MFRYSTALTMLAVLQYAESPRRTAAQEAASPAQSAGFPRMTGAEEAAPPDQLDLAVVKLNTLPATDKQLVDLADRAFIGTVRDVQIKPEFFDGVHYAVPVKSVTFEIEEVLFDKNDCLSKDKPYVVRLYAEGSRPVRRGEKLLWYLAPNSDTGLTQPVGIDSGHFRFLKDGESVMNLKQNENLLKPSRIKALTDELAGGLPPSADRDAFREEVYKWARTASEPDEVGKPIPLDLLKARTKQLLESP